MGHNGRGGLLVRLHLGHKSTLLPKGHEQGHTHRWSVFVMSANKEHFKDRSFIDKVCFTLHPDFHNPKRLVKEPPFQVTETGYAGFSIPLEIWLGGKKYKVNYDLDLNLTMEPQALYTIPTTISVTDYTPEFYSIAKRFGAEKVKRAREPDTLVLPSICGPSSISPPPEKIRRKERSAEFSARFSPIRPLDRLKIRPDHRDSNKADGSSSSRGETTGAKRGREESTLMPTFPTPTTTPTPPHKEREKKENKSAEFSARFSPIRPLDRLKIRPDHRDSNKADGSSSSRGETTGAKRGREESTLMLTFPTPTTTPTPPHKEREKKENKMLDFVLDRGSGSTAASLSARPSPFASPAVALMDKLLRREEKRKDMSASASLSTSAAVERLKKEERKREKASSSSVSEKEKKKERNGFTPSPPEKEKRKEKDADRLPGLSPPEKEKEKKKERKEMREKDDDRFGGALSEKKKAEKARGAREKEDKEPPSLAELAIKREKEREKELRKERKERDRLRDLSRPSSASDREKDKDKEKKERPLPSITPPPVLLRQEFAPSSAMAAAMAAAAATAASNSFSSSSSSARYVSPPTLVPININGHAPPPPPAPTLFYGGGPGTSVINQHTGAVVLPSLLTSNFMPVPMPNQVMAGSSGQGGQGGQGGLALQHPSPSGSLGGRETPSEKASRSSISPGLRNEETASSGGLSASSHSSSERSVQQKRIPKLAPSQRDREAMSAPLASVDASTVRRKIESLTDPEKVFEVALLLLDLDDTSHISVGSKTAPPSLSYDLGGLDQKDLLRLDSILNGS